MESCAQSQDVVVVGGGVAGLAAAERLYQAGLQVGDSFSFPFYPQISLM
jgi:flavin-dependent dehydrogenase